ncbi:MAG: flippase [Clostridiales bacterium]|nr:flippase [Clostridiales bacterium]
MNRSITKNYLYNLSYQVFVILAPLITTPYISRVLGVKNVGTYNYAQSIVDIFILIGCIGLNLYGQRQIAYVSDKPAERSRAFWELEVLRVLTLTVTAVVFIFSVVNRAENQRIYWFLFIEIAASVLDINWFFQGLENFKIIAIRNFVVKSLGILAIFLFVKNEQQLDIYCLCYAATLLLGNLSLWVYLPKQLVRIPLKSLRIFSHFLPSLVIFIPQIATSIYTMLDKTMIGLLSDDYQVSYYSQGEKVVKLALTIVVSLSLIMLSRVAKSFAEDKLDEVKGSLIQSFRLVFLLGFPITLGLIGIAPDMVQWFFGDGYEPVIPVMMVISPIVLFIGLSGVTGTQFLVPTKRMKEYSGSVAVGMGINVILNFFLIRLLGSIGASIASVIAEFSVMALQVFFVRKDFEWKLLKPAWKNAVSAVIMLDCIFASRLILPHNYWLTTAVQITGGFAIYAVCLLLLRDDFALSLLNTVISKIPFLNKLSSDK